MMEPLPWLLMHGDVIYFLTCEAKKIGVPPLYGPLLPVIVYTDIHDSSFTELEKLKLKIIQRYQRC